MNRELCLRNRQGTRPVDLPLLRRITRHLLSHFGRDQFALAIHLIATPEMTRLNEQFLGHAGSTDVIAFDFGSERGEPFGLGPPSWKAKGPTLNSSAPPGARARPRADKPDGAALLHGEIFISIDQALGHARRYQTTWQEELTRYLIHGLLHLHGYDDLNPPARRKMKQVENRLLRQISRAFDLRRLTGKRRASNPRS